jgi:hypothetical protein
MTCFSRANVKPGKASQRTQRCSRQLGKIHIKLHDLIACSLARVFHIHFDRERIAGFQFRTR